MWQHPYLQLFKPGIIMGNLLTLWAGFFLASQGQIDLGLLCWLTLGTALVIASGAAFNNVIDRDIDALMSRTQQRALVLGLISPAWALALGSLFGVLGLMLLLLYGGWLTGALALGGWLIYVLLYSLWWKRHSIHGVAVGSLSGAAPPMMGYCAVTQTLDWLALGLGLTLCLWQIPHAYAIALRRLSDYRTAGLRLLPLVKGVALTQTHLRRYILVFTLAATSLWWLGPLSAYYGVLMLTAGLIWWRAAAPLSANILPHHLMRQWGLKMFAYSIVLIMLFCLLLVLESTLPLRDGR
ncbi:MAG: heme o synthase [Neisseriaceae bacterium]|nr:heme o synthase [Neisseriaceae bacterium]MBP6861838.1 heme o synthase [Neisseriaceae bacterium]